MGPQVVVNFALVLLSILLNVNLKELSGVLRLAKHVLVHVDIVLHVIHHTELIVDSLHSSLESVDLNIFFSEGEFHLLIFLLVVSELISVSKSLAASDGLGFLWRVKALHRGGLRVGGLSHVISLGVCLKFAKIKDIIIITGEEQILIENNFYSSFKVKKSMRKNKNKIKKYS